MLTKYMDTAMRKAEYKIPDDATYFGEIPPLRGVWANADTLEECRDELQSGPAGSIKLRLDFGDSVPEIDGITLSVKTEDLA